MRKSDSVPCDVWVTSAPDNLSDPLINITVCTFEEFPIWREQQSQAIQSWLTTTFSTIKAGALSLLPNPDGTLAGVLFVWRGVEDFWSIGRLPLRLPKGVYTLSLFSHCKDYQVWQRMALAWALGSYQFAYFKKPRPLQAQLLLPELCYRDAMYHMLEVICWTRDLINMPAEQLGPEQLAQAVHACVEEFPQTSCHTIVGEELLKENYPLIHLVGRASFQPPRLIDFSWGHSSDPKLVLVGKGVCFDTGGLQIKSSQGMLLMKKDMGGAAHVLALARWIMLEKLPVRLRVLVPAVENSVSDRAFRPGDVVVSRKKISVEITNTDAEGRLILADALTEACSDNPDLLIDFATLTGAARIALGPDIPALFGSKKAVVDALMQCSHEQRDPLWPMPLYSPYKRFLKSHVADIKNASSVRYAGAVTAALFLNQFIDPSIDWLHIDLMAFHVQSLPGRPQGGDAMGLRAIFSYLKQRFISARSSVG